MNDPASYSEMFRPPIDRTMKVLDRTFFQKKITLSAACTKDNTKISELRKALSHEILQVDRVPVVRQGPKFNEAPQERKAILLNPSIRHDEPSTWTPAIAKLQESELITLVPFELDLDYKHWTYDDIMESILPESDHNEIPSGFAVVGHVAHLNLRAQYLPYKYLIAEVLMDKSTAIKTVINKIDDVGAENEFRTFKFEVLKGDPSLEVELKELGCIFRFDYAKVYWNSKLNTEHERLVNLFKPGEAICDVMAGVGPFAMPAAKRELFVWANDLNPESYNSMVENTKLNKVTDFLKPFNLDGRQFIRQSAEDLLNEDKVVEVHPKVKRSRSAAGAGLPPVKHVQPKTFDHYVMNLPATATHFLDAFIGLYSGKEDLFEPSTTRKLPMVHVYCFSTKSDDNKREGLAICEELTARLGHPMKIGENELSIYDVRDVAPNKRMFCASFRLPPEVAFRNRT